MCALIGAGFYAATMLMRTMVPLRVFGIVSALFFMAYGALAGAMSTFFMYLLLLPINSWRLVQMRGLVKKARVAAQGDLSMDWLKPFMNRRIYRRGDVLFRKGQPANEMFLTVTGKFLVSEIGIELPPGRLMGELGFVTRNNRRTQTVECIENGEVLTITYDRLLEIYFDNPEFGYFFLRLASDRLLQNIARLEGDHCGYRGHDGTGASGRFARPRRQVQGADGNGNDWVCGICEGRGNPGERGDFARRDKDPSERSPCDCGEIGRTFFFVVWGSRNYSGAVRRPGCRRRDSNSNVTPHFANLRRSVFR